MMKRRDFIKSAGAVPVLAMGNRPAKERKMEKSNVNSDIPRRKYGKTGIELSIIGFGGIVVMNAEQYHANKVVAEFVERGINYFDVAPTYGDAELRLGPALEPYREDCFLACKTTKRDKKGAREELEQSLKNLRTDHFDLYQLHAITDVEKDVEAAFAKDGCMETFIEAKKSGQVRHLGFSAHSETAALRALELYDFDSILFPVNFATVFKGQFGPAVMEKAREKGAAILALKALANEKWPENHPLRQDYSKCWYHPADSAVLAEMALRFTLSQPGVTAAVPPGEELMFRLACEIAVNYKPVTDDETERLKQIAQKLEPIFEKA